MWRSLVAHLHGVQGAAGSNPVTPTIHKRAAAGRFFLYMRGVLASRKGCVYVLRWGYEMSAFAIGSILTVEIPFSKHNFYSTAVISRQDLVESILEALETFPEGFYEAFDAEALAIKVDERKTLTFEFKEDLDGDPDFEEVRYKRIAQDVKTRIYIDVEYSVLGSEICVRVIQNLQKKFPVSIFIDRAKVAVCGEDMQKIIIDYDFLYDLKESSEQLTDDDFK